MALLSLSPAHLPITVIAVSSSFPIRLQNVSVALNPTLRHSLLVHAPVTAQWRCSAVGMALAGDDPTDDESEDEEDIISIQNLPLESKLQLKLEHKMKMKISKKVRLRRKRLMRKRRMRKRGRWPPSKMKKLKNV